jgi:hypothetical protein
VLTFWVGAGTTTVDSDPRRGAVMTQITTSGDSHFHRRPVFLRVLALALCSCLALTFAEGGEARAASIGTSVNSGSAVFSHPFVLDQSGQPIVASGRGKTHAVVLAPGSVPTYLAYRLPSNETVPSGVPTVDAGSSGGKLQFTPLVSTRLSQDLAQHGEAAISSGTRTFLVQPLPSVLGASGGTASPQGTSHAWRAALSTLRSDLASRSGPASSTSTSTPASTTSSSVPATTQAQTLTPTNILDPTANSKLLKDMEHLLTLKSGKFPYWDQRTFNALKSDLSLSSPKNVAPDLTTTTTAKPVYEAQVLTEFGSSATSPQPTPAPEPGTLAIFGLAALAFVYRFRSRQ